MNHALFGFRCGAVQGRGASPAPRHPDRVCALLRDAGVVDDQRPGRAVLFDDGQDTRTHRRQHRGVGPIGLGQEVMQRLMRRLHAPWLHPRGHRFDAFAITGQQQSRAIGSEWRTPVSMTKQRLINDL